MKKQELVNFTQESKESNAEPISSKTEYHYAVCDESLGVVVITRELPFNGELNKKYFTLIWEYFSGRWQVVKETAVVRN